MSYRIKTGKKTMFLLAVLTASLILAMFTLAADEEYDSSVDPLITYSYLEARIGELKTQYENEITDLTLENESLYDELEAYKNQLSALSETVTALQSEVNLLKSQPSGGGTVTISPDDIYDAASAVLKYEVIKLSEGDVVYAVNGSLELILRSGNAVVESPFPSQGISDNTEGVDLLDGTEITQNHMLLIPRGDDGRGVFITSGTAYIMIRGEYIIGD